MLFHPRAFPFLDSVIPKLILCFSPAAPYFWGTVQELLLLTVKENFLLKYLYNRVKTYIQKLIKMIENIRDELKSLSDILFWDEFCSKVQVQYCLTSIEVECILLHLYAYRRIQLCKHNIAKWNLEPAVCEIWSWVWQWFSLPWTVAMFM